MTCSQFGNQARRRRLDRSAARGVSSNHESPVTDLLDFASPTEAEDNLGKLPTAVVLQFHFGGDFAEAHGPGSLGQMGQKLRRGGAFTRFGLMVKCARFSATFHGWAALGGLNDSGRQGIF